MRKAFDWASVDWDLPNVEIARKLGASVNTVAKRRTTHGHPHTSPRKQRSDIGASRPHSIPLAKAVQPIATAAAKASLKAGRGVSNVHAVEWVLLSPTGEQHTIRNLYEFVRSNTHLFAAADVVWKRTGGRRGTGGEWCNATAGILNIKGGRAKSWKGWTLKP